MSIAVNAGASAGRGAAGLREKSTRRILLLEDDRALADGIRLALRDDATEIDESHTIAEAKNALDKNSYALVILDLGLPDGDGLSLLREIKRRSETPVILLTAKDLETDIVTGLESGADDYITKPFSLAILRARVRTQLRKSMPREQVYTDSVFHFDFTRMEFRKKEEKLELSKTEQRLLRIFTDSPNVTISREKLIDAVWSDGAAFVEENALSVAVKRLREKLGDSPSEPKYLATVYGIGYVWRAT